MTGQVYLNVKTWGCVCGYSMPVQLDKCVKCGAERKGENEKEQMTVPLEFIEADFQFDLRPLDANDIASGVRREYAVHRLTHSQRGDLLSLHANLQDALGWLDEAPAFEDYRRKVIACLRSTE